MRTWATDTKQDEWAGEFLPPYRIWKNGMIVGYVLDPVIAQGVVDACNAAELLRVLENGIEEDSPEEARLRGLSGNLA